MAKKKNQLPSGKFRVQAYDYTDADGKKHYKSFTATSKKQAQLMAAEWQANKGQIINSPENLTVYDAVGRYIDAKKGALSPSTVVGYEQLRRNYFKASMGLTRLPDLNSSIVQMWVSELSGKLSPKTVRNAYGLLSSTLDMFAPDLHFKITLPARKRPELYCPSDKDLKLLLDSIHGTELEIAVLLAALGPLRRGEICALNDTDIVGNNIKVGNSMVLGPDNEWHVKVPKTYGSYREVEFPSFVIEKICGIQGRIIKMNPNQVSDTFNRALKRTGLPHFRFHDLRHYAASIMHAIGIPDQYILQRGGWASDNVMKTVYRNTINIETKRQTRRINKHFEKLNSV